MIGALKSTIDWQKEISHENASVDYLPLYATKTAKIELPTEKNIFNYIDQGYPVVFCFSSPSSIRMIARSKFGKMLGSANVQAIAIGPTTEKECQTYFEQVKVSPKATLESLLQLAESTHSEIS